MNSSLEQQLREVNEALLISSVRQHELIELAEKAESKLHESESQFRQIADSMPQIVWTARPDGYVDYYNERWYEYTGFPRDEFGQSSWEGILHPDDLQRCIDTYFGCIREGTPFEIEYRFKDRHRGGYRWYMGRALPIRNDAGEIVRWFGTSTDIDDQKRTQEVLRESERRFRNMADTAPSMIWMNEPDGLCTFLSRSWYEFTGQDDDTGLGLGWIEAVHPEDRDRIRSDYFATIARHKPFSVDYRLRRADGEYRWCIDAGRPRFGLAGEFQGYIGSLIDVHERKLVEEALQDADHRKNEFLATLAHELRNPLAPIRNSLHILRMAGDEDLATRRVHEMMERQVGHLVRLVDDLLEVSRITSGKFELRTEPVEIAAVIRSALETSKPLIDNGGHQIATSLPLEPLTVEADPIRLSQVIANLLNNAAKYTEPGGQIWLTVSRAGGEVIVSVRDNGIGISSVMLPRVFQMFMQVDRDHKRSQGGLGIGLALAKKLIEMHGGQIEANSAGDGLGSEFMIRLPLAQTQLPVPDGGAATLLNERPLPRNRILIIDDNKDAASSLCALLRMLGNDVQTANDGVSALKVIVAYHPSIVLLDLGMPGMNGYEVARHVRELPQCQNTVIIALTGWGQEADRRRTREAGFNHHLVKPVNLDALEGLLAEVQRQQVEHSPPV